ncbi:MAG TPA: contractile injection system protein, VgrG/Pvc8 family [Enhygromyxa sp.]|nr:contractile injection system protein, VgrG/Pvc8 family [Enhygromyxa sp.]
MPTPKLNVLLDDERLTASVLAQLDRVEVHARADQPSMLALRFRMRQAPDGEWAPIDDAELFSPARRISVDLEAPGGVPTRVFSGHVSHVRPHFESIESNCYVEVLAADRAALMDVEDKLAAWPDKTDGEVVSEIFSAWGIDEVEVADTQASHAADKHLLMQRESDWRFIQRLARRNGCSVWLEPGEDGAPVGYFGPLPLDRETQADLTILRAGSNLVWVDVQQLSIAPVRLVGAAIDPIEKRIVRSEGEPELESLGAENLADTIESALQGFEVGAAQRLLRDGGPTAEAIAAFGTGSTDSARFVLEARGELDASLYRGLLRPHRPVLLKGVGRRFAGKWWVHAVRTTLESNHLRQHFVLIRNDLDLTGSEEFGREAEEVEAQ